MNSTGIKLAIGAPWPFAFYKQNKTRKKRKETRGEIIVLKYLKARGSKLNATEIRLKFVLYKIAPVDINETLWNNKADLLITCIKANMDLKMVLGESRSQASQNRICAVKGMIAISSIIVCHYYT